MSFAQIEQAFESGVRLVHFKASDAFRTRKRLYEMAYRRRYTWRFATLPGEVFVVKA